MTARKTKQKHNTICVGHHYTQANTNNVNKTWALLQTIGGKDEPSIVLSGHRNGRRASKEWKETIAVTYKIGSWNT